MDDGMMKSSRMSTATAGNENMVFGRDAVIEREKINNEARNTFAVMDARYQDMVNDLIELDNAFELGLTNGNREEFEKRIQNVRIVKTPPKRPHELPRIELTVDEVIPVVNGEEISEVQEKSEDLKDTEKLPATHTVDETLAGSGTLDQVAEGKSVESQQSAEATKSADETTKLKTA